MRLDQYTGGVMVDEPVPDRLISYDIGIDRIPSADAIRIMPTADAIREMAEEINNDWVVADILRGWTLRTPNHYHWARAQAFRCLRGEISRDELHQRLRDFAARFGIDEVRTPDPWEAQETWTEPTITVQQQTAERDEARRRYADHLAAQELNRHVNNVPPTGEQLTNNEEATMSKADRDYTLLDLKRLSQSMIRRKIDRLDLSSDEAMALYKAYEEQVEYLLKVAKSYPQVLMASYLDLMQIKENTDFSTCVTDKGELNKLVMDYVEANRLPVLPPSTLTADEIKLLGEGYAGALQATFDDSVRKIDNDLQQLNEMMRAKMQDVTNYKRRMVEKEQELAVLYDKRATITDSDQLSSLFVSQIDLIQSKLNWQYIAFYDGFFWFRTPHQMMTKREGGNTDVTETCWFTVAFKPLAGTSEKTWKAYAGEGFVSNGKYGSPFHSNSDFCYGSARNEIADKLAMGDMFHCARVMQFLMTTYQADGPYRTWGNWVSHASRLVNWTHTEHLKISGCKMFHFIYGNGDWKDMVARALSGDVHLKGNYIRPKVPIRVNASSNENRRYQWAPNDEQPQLNDEVWESFYNLFLDVIDNNEAGYSDYNICFQDHYFGAMSKTDFLIRLARGDVFEVMPVDELDYSSHDYWIEHILTLRFTDGRKAYISFRVEYHDEDSWDDRLGRDTWMNAINSTFRCDDRLLEVSADFVQQTASSIDLNLYCGVNQRRILMLQTVPNDILQRGSLTEILRYLSTHHEAHTATMPEMRGSYLESLELFHQEPIAETTNNEETENELGF